MSTTIEEVITYKIRTEKDRNSNHSHVNGLMATGESRLDMDCTPAMNPCTFPFNE